MALKTVFNPLSGSFDLIQDLTEVESNITDIETDVAELKDRAPINFLAEDFTAYADTAAVIPADGTGGSPTITVTNSEGSFGERILLIEKPASNVQGQGASSDFSVPSWMQTRMMNISALVDMPDAPDEAVRVYVYDVTNSALLGELVARDLTNNYTGRIQLPHDAADLRLIFHIASTDTTAYDITLNNLKVEPAAPRVKGQVILQQGSEVLNTATIAASSKAVGAITRAWGTDSLYTYDSATGNYTATRDIEATISTSVRVGDTQVQAAVVVNSVTVARDFTSGTVDALANASWRGRIEAGQTFWVSNASGVGSADQHFTTVSATYVSDNVILSEDAGNRRVVFRGYRSSALNITSSGTSASGVIPIDTIEEDSTNSYDSGQNGWVVPETGDYDITATAGMSESAIVDTSALHVRILVDGSVVGTGQYQASTSGKDLRAPATGIAIPLVKGQLVQLAVWHDIGSTSALKTGTATRIDIAKRSSPQTMAGGDPVAAIYSSDSGQSIGTSSAVLTFEDREEDTSGIFNGTTATIPKAGLYAYMAQVSTALVTLSTAQYLNLEMFLDGSINKHRVRTVGSGGSTNYSAQLNGAIRLNKGQTIDFRAFASVATTALNSGLWVRFSLVRIGD